MPSSLNIRPVARDNASAFIALGVLVIFWGYNWVVMKVALNYAAPFDFVALRTFGGSLTLMLLLVALRRPLRPRHVAATMLLGLLQTTGFAGLVTLSLVQGQAGKSAVIAYTMPFWVILFSWVFLGERLRGRQWLAVGLALMGLIGILEPWRVQANLVSSGLALVAGVCWGASVIVVKKIPIRGNGELLSLTAWQMGLGSLPLIAMALLIPSQPIHWSWTFISALIYNIVPGNALAWALWLYILQKLSAGASGLASLAVPVCGVICAWLQLGERPDRPEAAGMLLILSALALLSMIGLRSSQSRQKS